jgi:hypothetical protein
LEESNVTKTLSFLQTRKNGANPDPDTVHGKNTLQKEPDPNPEKKRGGGRWGHLHHMHYFA